MSDIDDINKNNEIEESGEEGELSELKQTVQLSGMYQNWFLDYASYVILERAVPDLFDGLKPVQRRILHSMKDLDDGRYNKVANIIGHTMKYHPHGDASIGDALVQMGQKDLLIDTQGNWGNIHTGDSAAAPRYIEARLTKFALEVVFNPKTTRWKLSYDGRNKEPITLPVKFPLLLHQGVEGIAVGLASKILPHNFIELIDASINLLNGQESELYPDFPTGGYIDVSKYNDGLRGGKIRVRAKINQLDKKSLVINEIPFGTTTTGLIDSIVAANDKGKIKIKKIEDNTAENVEIIIHLATGVSPDQTIDALYAFTDCEISISPNCCVIENDRPRFMGVKEILDVSTDNTVNLLRQELEIRKKELMEDLLYSNLEKIFIEKKIYRDIEECKTWEAVLKAIDKGLEPYKKKFYRVITNDDIIRLTEIKIKRISKFDVSKANDIIKSLESEMTKVDYNLDNIIEYAIAFFNRIKEKYGDGRARKTEIRNFDTIEAVRVVATNQKLYVNREEGFAGTSLKKDEYICDCSDIDDIIVFKGDGSLLITKIADKIFVGNDIIYINTFFKNDDRTIYNMIYQDGPRGNIMMKRFAVTGVTRDKEYDLTRGTKGSKVLYFSANPNGEAEVVTVHLRPKPKLKKINFDVDFSTLAIKGRNSIGNIVTRHSVRKIVLKGEGVSTLGDLDIWYDDTVMRLNTEKRGKYLGAFSGDDKILTIMSSGELKLSGFDLSTHFDEDMMIIEKYKPNVIVSIILWDGELQKYYVKRFDVDANTKRENIIGEHPESRLLFVFTDKLPRVEVMYTPVKNKHRDNDVINLAEFIGVKSYKAKGKRLTDYLVDLITPLEPIAVPEDEITEPESENMISEPETESTEPDIVENENNEQKIPDKKKFIAPPKDSDDDEVQMKLDF
ncbi:MAG TPA: DNA gyrase/topoisomerase IV subunit A [Bacteroidales bacterium]|nr:DNA gyrase/topoisomerase IV subunit A [Bacteroidales bacterium]HPS18147.1 DNA gyrase/topoisomerase IV subunit A [Bacteroidales bacterium]